jgi:hypothetical protein
MSQISEARVGTLQSAQAAELSLLVDLEACWENLRKPTARQDDVVTTMKELSAKQKAYDAFRVRLVAYNKRHPRAHVPELLLNTPTRLGTWCRAMQNLYLQLEHDPQAHCPVHLLEKAYRWADQIGHRLNRDLVSRATPPATIGDAIRSLGALAQWCDELIGVAHPGPRAESPVPAPHQGARAS